MKVTSRELIACAVLAAAAVTIGAAAAVAQMSRTVDAGGGLHLTTALGRTLLREPSGEVSDLALPRGASVRRLVRLADGWVAAGVLATGQGTELYLLRDDAGSRERLPSPPAVEGEPPLGWPVPLVEDGRLAGLAWLAGPAIEKATVRASLWSGSAWSPPEVVSAAGPGTQIALAGAVLADDSWLLVWSGYDGSDDEILWSRRSDGRWSEPQTLHAPNDTPDILPAVVPAGPGALAAWSWFDGGDYRLKLARLDGGGWTELDHLGPPGSLRAGLTPAPTGALLLYRTVAPPTWTLRELDLGGTVLRTAVVPVETTVRPAIAPADERGPGLEWLGAGEPPPVVRVTPEWRPQP